MQFDSERIYKLLPAMYRIRDAELTNGETPLKALIEILAREISVIEEDLDQLYDDQFIETCAEWVVPYIGELVGARTLINTPGAKYSRRAEVANTISYRRRKGTASILEQLARDVTQWDANVVEYFQLLATTQYLNHIRPGNLSITSLREWQAMELIDTPFDRTARSVDVRNIDINRGKYNIQNIGIFLWRIKSYTRKESVAFKIADFRYTFDSCGLDIPLYNHPISEEKISQLANPSNVCMPITRRFMHEDIEKLYGLAQDEEKIFIKIGNQPILPSQITVCNLSDNVPAATWFNMPSEDDSVVIDPVLGRLAFAPNFAVLLNNNKVEVWYNCGFSADMGGGEYNRIDSIDSEIEAKVVNVPADFSTIPAALSDLGVNGGIVEITGNGNYPDDLNIDIGSDTYLEIRAKDGYRPVLNLSNDIAIKSDERSQIVFNGLLIDGGNIKVANAEKLQQLKIIHCTIKPMDGGNLIDIRTNTTSLIIDKSIVSGIRLDNGADGTFSDSIIDVVDRNQLAISDKDLNASGSMTILNCSIVGGVIAEKISEASNTIFYSRLEVVQLQSGCIRFSYFPESSITPRSYKCQPELSGYEPHVYPSFTSTKYGDPGYFQLHENTVKEIANGGDNDSEMGAFYSLYTTQKVNNLRTRLNEYLRFGMEAGIFFAS